ncbi:MAG TPA: ABC transporter ATP-binding protein [Thermomicrobiales bacterium]|jgi:branched-chain amino acid transport system ATP-binding protein|nr:ABC transporter ATP-binding protein [Thermomicrobiales bacterium]
MSQSAVATDIILEVRNVSKRFGGIQAVNDASLGIERGKVTGVIGPNGSGKSTMFNLITGLETPDSGQIIYKGENIAGKAPHVINRMGMGRTFQLTRLFGTMTVLENLTVITTDSFQGAEELAEKLLANLGLTRLKNEYAANLSYGQQKLVEFLRLSMIESDLILLDEPFAGVNPVMEKKLLEQIDMWVKEGKTVLLTDHEMAIMMELCESIYVFDYGSVIAHGTPQEVRENPRVMEAYFGS